VVVKVKVPGPVTLLERLVVVNHVCSDAVFKHIGRLYGEHKDPCIKPSPGTKLQTHLKCVIVKKITVFTRHGSVDSQGYVHGGLRGGRLARGGSGLGSLVRGATVLIDF